jgi:hypothetical protein
MIDASIYSAVGRGVEPFNPLADLAQVQQIQGFQNQNRLAQLAFSDRERAQADEQRKREIYSGGLQGAELETALLRGGYAADALKFGKDRRENAATDAKTAGQTVETGQKAFDLYRQQLGTVQDPQQAASLVAAAYNDPTIGPLMQRYGTLESGLQRLQEALAQPNGFAQWKANAAIGIEKLASLAQTQNVNLGGNMVTQTVQPATGEVTRLASAPITVDANTRERLAQQAREAAASRDVQMRGQNMADARAREGLQQGKVPSGYRANPDGSLSFIPGGPADPNRGGDLKLTEDQGKATGWLVQADNAFKNMKAAIDPKQGGSPSAAKPGINDAIAAIPSFGAGEAVANLMRGENRQKFMQGASSLSESLLRAATGAGVNKDEAVQKIREITPVFGEADSVTRQKLDAIPLYIESLRVRAGPGGKKAADITRGVATGDWSVKEVK